MYADYEETKRTLARYPAWVKVIGSSVFGRKLYVLQKGKGGILVQAGMHAREHITTRVLLRLVQYRSIMSLFPSIALVPLVNPDGVELCLKGAEGFPNRETLLRINGGADFSGWKANARGVDLNVNFNAEWGKGKNASAAPAPQGYAGAFAESEPESKALATFARMQGFDVTVSLHAKGEEVYAGFLGFDPDPSLSLALSRALGYPLKESVGSVGGFKDWYVFAFRKPSFTIELGKDSVDYKALYKEEQDLVERTYRALCAVGERYAKG